MFALRVLLSERAQTTFSPQSWFSLTSFFVLMTALTYKERYEAGGYSINYLYGTTATNDNAKIKQYIETLNASTFTTTFAYDLLQRPVSTTDSPTSQTRFYYDERGNQARLENAHSTVYQDFDDAGRINSQTVMGNTSSELKYEYFSNGQLDKYTQNGVTEAYVYDFAKRLTSWDNGGQVTTYSYDKAGNLLNPHDKTLTFNGANEVEQFDYDGAGNLIRDDKYQYVWDGEGRLTQVKDLAGNVKASYTWSSWKNNCSFFQGIKDSNL